MATKISARQTRSMMRKADIASPAASSSPMGACVATRFRPGTIDVCREMSRAACTLVRKELERSGDGTANFFEGGNCP